MRLAVLGVPKGALRTHGLTLVLGPCFFVHGKANPFSLFVLLGALNDRRAARRLARLRRPVRLEIHIAGTCYYISKYK